jgi:class 3 adenylate cyclase
VSAGSGWYHVSEPTAVSVVAHFRYTGAANKNIGDAFLLVWTLNKTDIQDHMNAGNANTESEAVQELEVQLTDNALYAFIKIVVDIHNASDYGVLARFVNHDKIRERFPQGFEVRLGFGLHHGWAIEGTATKLRTWWNDFIHVWLTSCMSLCFPTRRHDWVAVQD